MTSPTTRADFLYGRFQSFDEVVHRVEHTAMHGLQAVASIGQRSPDDHGHRVVQVGLTHLVFDVDRGARLFEFLHVGLDVALSASNVEITDVERVLLDEATARLDLVAHQRREDFVRLVGIFDLDLQQHPYVGIHRRFPELLGVHLAEALETLHFQALPRMAHQLGDRVDQRGGMLLAVGGLQREWRISDLPSSTASRRSSSNSGDCRNSASMVVVRRYR